MDFSDLDKKMRTYEEAHDHCVLPGLWMIVRVDGRSFTKLTKIDMELDIPFAADFRDWMVAAATHVIENSGFRILYAHTHSDEASFLIHKDDVTFGRKLRKINTTFASGMTAAFNAAMTEAVYDSTGLWTFTSTFDCRVSQLPSPVLVEDYFRWRQQDAHRNALNSWAYWALRGAVGTCPTRGPYTPDMSGEAAQRMLDGEGDGFKNELLFQYGINYNDTPLWHRRGVALYWVDIAHEGLNPVTGKTVQTTRRRVQRDLEVPSGDTYGIYLYDRMGQPRL